MNNLELRRLLIRHYMTEERKKEFVLRIRDEKMPKIVCYYKGIALFWLLNKDKFLVNKAVFLPNSKNAKDIIEKYKDDVDSIYASEKDKDCFNRLLKCGFKLMPIEDIKLELSSKVKYEKHKIKLDENMKKIKECLEYAGVNIDKWKKIEKDGMIKRFKATIKNPNDNYDNLYKFIIHKYGLNSKLTPIYNSSKGPNFGFKSLQLDVKIIPKSLDFFNEKMLSSFDDIMKDRIDNYSGSEEENDNLKLEANSDEELKELEKNDLGNTRKDSEKEFQQKLMCNMSDDESRTKIINESKGIFDENDIPFEMEYFIYPAKKGKENGRSRHNKKGRIDNVFINYKDGIIKLIEVKMNDSVIGGTNGIHKHLLDLLNCVSKNGEISKEIKEYASERNAILNDNNININGFEYSKIDYEKEYKLKYYIICGYNDKCKRDIGQIFNKIKDLPITNPLVFNNADENKNGSNKVFVNSLKKYKNKKTNRYEKEFLEFNVAGYCKALKENNNSIKVKEKVDVEIWKCYEDFTKFELMSR